MTDLATTQRADKLHHLDRCAAAFERECHANVQAPGWVAARDMELLGNLAADIASTARRYRERIAKLDHAQTGPLDPAYIAAVLVEQIGDEALRPEAADYLSAAVTLAMGGAA